MLEGAYNFRDLGGLPTRTGGTCDRGACFAATHVQALTITDAQRLHGEMVAEEGRGCLAAHADIRYANLPLQMAATEGVAPDHVMHHLYLGCLAPNRRSCVLNCGKNDARFWHSLGYLVLHFADQGRHVSASREIWIHGRPKIWRALISSPDAGTAAHADAPKRSKPSTSPRWPA